VREPAPIRPPISACELEDGSPSRQDATFQTIPPNRPARIESRAIPFGSTMPLPIVFATASDENAPAMFSPAAKITATFGPIAFVVTGTAMAFAESWNPLVKSKSSPRATIRTM
jgi:hypothetical protein